MGQVILTLYSLKSIFTRLTEKYANELKSYRLVCYYCGCKLDSTSVNKKCKANQLELKPDCKKFKIYIFYFFVQFKSCWIYRKITKRTF